MVTISSFSTMPKCVVYLFVVFFVSVITLSSGYTLHKCCPYNQQLSPDFETCVDFIHETIDNNSTNNTETLSEPMNATSLPWWFFQDVEILNHTLYPINLKTSFLRGKFPLDVVAGEDLPCSFHSTRIVTSVDDYFAFLEDGTLVLYNNDYNYDNQSFSSLSYCVDRLQVEDNYWHVIKLCPCLTKFCIRKCCSPKKILKVVNVGEEQSECFIPERNVTEHWESTLLPETAENLTYSRLLGLPKCHNPQKNLLLIQHNDLDSYTVYINENTSNVHIEKSGRPGIIKYTEYCADVMEYEDGTRMPNIVHCTEAPVSANSNNGLYYGVLVIIGAIFLLATLLVYSLLPELRNLHGNNFMAHTASFLVGYIALGAAHLDDKMPYNLCVAIGFVIQFTFLAAFFWLNVMCIDISWRFSGLRPPQGSASVRDHKKFVYYSLYAWGSTGVISAITAIVEFAPGEHLLRPGFGRRSCLFNGTGPAMVYFYIPMALLLVTNLGLFLYTAVNILAVRRQTAFLHTPGSATYNSEKQRLVLYVKLFLLMGVTWVTEIISFAVGGPHEYWYLTDTINLLRAVFIFILFCCKRSVFQLFKRRYRNSLRGWSVTQKPDTESSRSHENKARLSQDNMAFSLTQPTTANTPDVELSI